MCLPSYLGTICLDRLGVKRVSPSSMESVFPYTPLRTIHDVGRAVWGAGNQLNTRLGALPDLRE